MTHADEEIIERVVAATLEKLGIEPGDHKEMQADFAHLRKWRKSVEQAGRYSFQTVVTTLIVGGLGALWLGVQTMLHK